MEHLPESRVTTARRLMRTLFVHYDHCGESMRSMRAVLLEHAIRIMHFEYPTPVKMFETYELRDLVADLRNDPVVSVPSKEVPNDLSEFDGEVLV